jgi:hypothetical protein
VDTIQHVKIRQRSVQIDDRSGEVVALRGSAFGPVVSFLPL